ncbi:hypothetical protein, partial [Micromonospora sp. NPDC002575]|uniref:hypothetical protein n=1 Tax=Micromonospora sp. NPDC002575 TaxID=3364222 RepID=UPI0036CCF307
MPHNDGHGHRLTSKILVDPDHQAVAAPRHGNTPNQPPTTGTTPTPALNPQLALEATLSCIEH